MPETNPDRSRPGPPLAEIRSALAEQDTVELRVKALRYAEERAARVRKAGRPIPKNYAEELVHDAVVSIWLGARGWDPERQSLHYRLCTIIKDRTWREIKRTLKHAHVSFDLAVNDASLDADVQDALAAGSVTDCSPVLIAEMTRQVVDELRILVRNDRGGAGAIVACWAQGFFEPDEIMALTGLTRNAFEAARLRILRLAKRLPPELREAAQNLLRSAS
jgi:hypothetical protein